MIILVCGDRNWTDRLTIRERLKLLPPETIIIHGGNGYWDQKTGKLLSGADEMAGEEAEGLGLEVRRFPADWDKHGKAAGPKRNSEMLAQKPGLVIAFHPDLKRSKGTADTLRKAGRLGILTEVISGLHREDVGEHRG